jgi:transposase-like protein
MARKRYAPEQSIVILRKIEILVGQGNTVEQAVKQEGINIQTYYRWRKEYGNMSTSDARRLKDLEKENTQLKKLVADLSLDNAILKDVTAKNF